MASTSDIFKVVTAFSSTELKQNFEEEAGKVIKIMEEAVDGDLLVNFENLLKFYKINSPVVEERTLKFVFISLECLLRLKDYLRTQTNEADKLLSVAQQRCIRCLLERVVCLGISVNLLPNVEPFAPAHNIKSHSTDIQKYECLCLVTLVLIDLYQDDTFHGIILPQFLSPILSGLCQLTMVPLRKTADTYPRLQRERIVFQKHLDELVSKLYRPMIVKELMMIEGNKNCPRWLKRGVGALLTSQLHRPQGLKAVLEAVRDAANCSAPTSPAHLEALARAVTSSPFQAAICSQIIELLDSAEADLVRFAVLCSKTIESNACESFILQPVTQPLTHPPSSEMCLTVCIQRLHKCFAVPASDLWCLPVSLLHKYIHLLFRLYCKVYQSASHLRKLVEDLVWTYLSKCDDKMLNSVLLCFVCQEKCPGIVINDCVDFEFGDNGGIKLVSNEKCEVSMEEFGSSIIILLERRDINSDLAIKLFIALLEFAAEKVHVFTIDMIEGQMVTMRLLYTLAENPKLQKNIAKNPGPIVNYLKVMIDKFITSQTKDVEIISVVLVLLNVILNDFIFSKSSSWEIFNQLKTPLMNLKKDTENVELQILAQEAYEVIVTRGATKSKQTPNNVPVGSSGRETNTCDDALRDACDPLLPVRGHAMMQLAKLLAAGDKIAKAKKDQILCIFQENLKHEDSYLYLSAIEGLSVMAAEFPDTVLVTLAEQFSLSSHKPDARLKVGEALVRVIKLLGDLVPAYKTELTNSLLAGTRDDDLLVRASSLSGLGELCQVLGFRVGPILTEVFMCARCIFTSDPSVEVRRAAVMLVASLLKGLNKDTLTVLQDVLVDLYQSLKRIYSSDKDDITRLHAQLALEELNSSTLAFLFPKPQLCKKIFILDPPS